MIIIIVLISIILGLILGFNMARKAFLVFVSCYFISTGRTARASDDMARVILNGKYVKEFNQIRMNSLRKIIK